MKGLGFSGPQMRTGRCFAGAGAEPLLVAAQRTALTHARACRLHLSRCTMPDCVGPSMCLRTRASPFDRRSPKPSETCPGTECVFLSPAFDVSSVTFICRSPHRRGPAQAHASACAAHAAAGNGPHGAAARPAAAAGAGRAGAQPESRPAADAGAHARHAANAGVGAAPGLRRRRKLRRSNPHRRLPAAHGHRIPDAAVRRPSARPPGCAIV